MFVLLLIFSVVFEILVIVMNYGKERKGIEIGRKKLNIFI